MLSESQKNLCLINAIDGLQEGLSHYSQPSRVAVIYAVEADDPIRICDPQNLLRGHEPKFRKLYLDSDRWRVDAPDRLEMKILGQIHPEKNLGLAGLISYGARSHTIFYQMWFTEHHPDMCSIGPTERWLEHACWLLTNDFAGTSGFYTGSSRYVLREYAMHAVRDYIVDEMNLMLGWDTELRVYPVLDAVLGISQTHEEGEAPRGQLLCVEPKAVADIDFEICFPAREQPELANHKHVRKLLMAVEGSARKLVSDGHSIIGVASGAVPRCRITADFRGRHGFLRLNGNPVCSFAEGSFHSFTYQAKMVQLEESLIESHVDPTQVHRLYRMVSRIVHYAEREKFGCTIVVDLNTPPLNIAGQKLRTPLDLRKTEHILLAQSLARVDGALHISSDLKMQGFACLLDGRAVTVEDRARGARFNSALRFTSEHKDLVVVVVSADRPVSVIQEGVELNAECAWRPVLSGGSSPPTLEEWLADEWL